MTLIKYCNLGLFYLEAIRTNQNLPIWIQILTAYQSNTPGSENRSYFEENGQALCEKRLIFDEDNSAI